MYLYHNGNQNAKGHRVSNNEMLASDCCALCEQINGVVPATSNTHETKTFTIRVGDRFGGGLLNG